MSLNNVIRSVISAVLLMAVGFGVPLLLVSVVGWPLPTSWPDWSKVWLDVRQLNINAAWVFGSLAVAGWLLWAQFVYSAGFEVANSMRVRRGLSTRRAPFAVPGVQFIAAKLVAGVMSVALLTASPAAAGALDALGSVPAVTAPATVETSPGERVVGSSVVATVVVGDNETVWDVASRVFDAPEEGVGELLRHNQISALDVKPGLELELPPGVSAPAAEVTVVKGDHLWGISESRLQQAGVANPTNAQIAAHVEQMVAANQPEIDNPDLIHPDDVYDVPALGDETSNQTNPAPSPESTGADSGPQAPDTINAPPAFGGDTESGDPMASGDEANGGETTGSSLVSRETVVDADTLEGSSDDDPSSEQVLVDDDAGWLRQELVVGGGAVAAAVLGFVLLQRRRMRGRGTQGLVWQPTPTERAVVSASSLPLMDWVGAELGELIEYLPTPATFAPVAVQWSTHGLEVLWDGPATVDPVLDWETTNAASWVLRYDDEALVRADSPAPAVPGLVTLGDQPSGATVSVDLEAVGSLAVTGAPAMVDGALRAFMVELGSGTSPLSNATIMTVGFTTEAAESLPRVSSVDLHEALQAAHQVSEQVRTASGSRHGSFALRSRGTTDESVVVIVAASDVSGLDELIRMAAPWSGVAVVVAGETNQPTTATFALDGDRGVLHTPYFETALEVKPVQVSHTSDSELAVMFDNSNHEQVTVDDAEIIERAVDISRTTITPPVRRTPVGVAAGSAATGSVAVVDDRPDSMIGAGHLLTVLEPNGGSGVVEVDIPPEAEPFEPGESGDGSNPLPIDDGADGPHDNESNNTSQTDTNNIDTATGIDTDADADDGVSADDLSADSEPAAIDNQQSSEPEDAAFADSDQLADNHHNADGDHSADVDLSDDDVLLPALADTSLVDESAEVEHQPSGESAQSDLDLTADSDTKPDEHDDADVRFDDPPIEDAELPVPPVPLIRVMGQVGLDGHRELKGIALRIVVALACAGERGLSTDMLVDQVWNGRQVQPRTITNQVAKIRRIVGPDRLPRRGSKTPAVLEGFMLDIDWLKHLVTEGAERSSTIEAAFLDAGLREITGPPLSAPGLDWPDLIIMREQAQVVIEGAVLRLVELALEMQDFDLAKRAIRQGVTALQLTEVMARARMRVAAAEQDARSIAAVYKQLQDELLRVFDHDEPSEETQTLRDELLASLTRPETERSGA